MNIRQVEIFKAIMETGSVTRAADELGIAQPSVSKHLKLLEQDLAFDLFDRSGNKLVPTPEAQALFEQIGRVYTGLGVLESFVEDLRNNQYGEVSIASMPLIAQKWLPRHVADFVAQHNEVSFSFPVRSSSWICSAVAARRVHFGIGLNPGENVPGIHAIPLMELPFVCVMPPDHLLTHKSAVRVESIKRHNLISLHSFEQQPSIFETLAKEAGEKRTIETFAAHVACELARQGAGIALVDALTARDNLGRTLAFRQFQPKTVMQICIITPAHWPLSMMASHLIDRLLIQANKTQRELADMIRDQ